MKRAFVVSLALVLVFAVSAAAQIPANWDISCQGTESNGGGGKLYQYELLNVSGGNLMLTGLQVTTDDLNLANYTNITAPVPAGQFVFGFGAVPGGWVNPRLKTPHGQIAPPPGVNDIGAGWVVWTLNQPLLVPALGTAVFTFDNPNPSENVDWVGNPEKGMWVGAAWNQPVAGPVGVFTHGPVHGPVPEPSTVVLLGIGAFSLLVYAWRRRPA
jgi:hypothetical protein